MHAEGPLGLFHILKWTVSVGVDFSKSLVEGGGPFGLQGPAHQSPPPSSLLARLELSDTNFSTP